MVVTLIIQMKTTSKHSKTPKQNVKFIQMQDVGDLLQSSQSLRDLERRTAHLAALYTDNFLQLIDVGISPLIPEGIVQK
jgi:hypothetical protein